MSVGPSRAPGWPAPAKLNLFLRVTGRRPDGYHELQTVFQVLDLADELRFEPLPGGRIELERPLPGVPPEADLCVRAARALAARTGRPVGVRIGVEKRIPMGAGLGGGSSDAATTLVALNALWGLGLERAELAALGLGLGADVPVFVHGRSAWAEGVGEVLEPLVLPEPWYAVVHPGCQVSTAAVFAAPELTRNSPPLKIPRSLLGVGKRPGIGTVLALAGNDCEAVVRRRYPPVEAARRWLSRRGTARMTGTGAAVFAPFPDPESAAAALVGLPPGWWGAMARGVNESPLIRALDSSHDRW